MWVPAENVVATWESVTAMSKLYNPAAQRAGTVTERSLSLAARVDVIDVNGLIGFDSTERGTLVLDETPRVFYSQAVPERYCRFYWPLRYIKTMPTPGQWVSQLQPYDSRWTYPSTPTAPTRCCSAESSGRCTLLSTRRPRRLTCRSVRRLIGSR